LKIQVIEANEWSAFKLVEINARRKFQFLQYIAIRVEIDLWCLLTYLKTSEVS